MDVFELIKTDGTEKPLEKIVADGGFCSIFRSIGCIGDSLSSGEHEGTDHNGNITYNDLYEYSWGQFISRIAGCTVYNFSCGGMTAKEFANNFGEKSGCWSSENVCQAYIIALGVNDIGAQKMELGSIEDIDVNDFNNNKETFAGYYGRIVQRLKGMQPDAKFFFMTMPRETQVSDEYARDADALCELIRDMAELFPDSYVIDFRKFAPVYDDDFKKNYYLGGHMHTCGYIVTARMVISYIDWIIRHNMSDFKQIAFIGTPHKNTVVK